ncbi:MAG: phosphatidylglycerol lysyltransferase domain-containing protein [Myxococcota bacterium]
MGWGYYFPHLLAQNRPGRSAVLVTEDSGSMCVFRWRVRGFEARLDLYLPPIPLNVPVLRRCLERANDFNRDGSAQVIRIDARDADATSEVRSLHVWQRRMQYVFAPAAYEDLAGTKYHTIRRNVALVQRRPDVEVVPYSTRHAEACRALLSRWQKAHREAHDSAGGVGASKRALELAGSLPERDLGGEVVLLDGHLSAFAFGGEIRPGLACSFDRKCETDVRGLSYFHFRSFLLRLRDFERVNDGSDTGRVGLRQLKDSFRPVEMHAEYRATQRDRG